MFIQHEISEELWSVIESKYQNGDYTGVIQDCFVYLSEIIRDKSDIKGDGTDLINKAFSENNPRIKINRLETTSDVDEQKGMANILRGLYQFVRNPRSHTKYDDSLYDCNSIIFFIDLIIKKIKGSTGQFEINTFYNQIVDEKFVRTQEYCNGLVNEIPPGKLYDTVLFIYNKKTSIESLNLGILFKSFFSKLSKDNIERLLVLISSDLRKTNDNNIIQRIICLLIPEMWMDIDTLARMRIENIIIQSIENNDYLATWCTELFKHFTSKENLFNIIEKKCVSDKVEDINYLYKYCFLAVTNLIKEDGIYSNNSEKDPFSIYPGFIWTIRYKIENGDKNHYTNIKKFRYVLPVFINRYFNDAIKSFDSKTSKPNIPEDIPF